MVKRLRRKNIRRLSPAIDDLIGPIGPIGPIKSTIRPIRPIRPIRLRKRQTISLTEPQQTAFVARGDRRVAPSRAWHPWPRSGRSPNGAT